MVASQEAHFGHGALAQLALVVGQDFHSAGANLRRHLIEHVKLVAREEVVLKIRHARLLAWMKRTDLSLVNYPNWTAFLTERSYWKDSRSRDLIRFVDSGLDHIMMLVACQVISLTVGLRAAKELPPNASEYDQLGWLADAVENPVPPRHRSRMREITGDDMRIVETARAVAKVLVGFSASVVEIDRFIVDCFVKKLTEEEIVERAKQVPPRPDRLDQPPPREWEREPKPPLLGDWVEPRDQADCMAQIDFTRARLEERRMILGMAYVHMQDHGLWRDKFYGRETLEEFCRDNLEIDQRTFERYASEGRELFLHPGACTAIATGRVTGDRAQFAIARGWAAESLEPWIDLASRLDCAEMARAEELHEPVDVAYGPALGMARQVESILAGPPTENGGDAAELASIVAGRPTAIGDQAAALIAQHVRTECPTRTGAIRVAIRDAVYRGPSPPSPSAMFVLPEVLEAAKWFADNVHLPKEHGTRETVVHDCYCCQNPRCRRTTIRVQSHHIWFQEHQGPDDDWNLVALCPSCHLRGVHSARMRLVRIGDWLVWTYGDGGVCITHSPVKA
jgi:5-methylcytosine-specific restriction endonuclease McrA